MIIFKKVNQLKNHLQALSSKSFSIGFVPTMGALHQGHLSLIHQSKQSCDITVCSIFINPAQFNNKTDFDTYPVTIDQDIFLLEKNETDILFLPSVEEIYPPDYHPKIYSLGYLENILEGRFRPGHFQGVCQIIDKLLNIIPADKIFMGSKDYQQCMVVQNLLKQLDSSTQMVICPTLRESSGLAMSSRNLKLNEEAIHNAEIIFKALSFIKENFKTLSFEKCKSISAQMLTEHGFEKIDYIEICDAGTLQPVQKTSEDSPRLICLIAAFINGVRLIDNLELTES